MSNVMFPDFRRTERRTSRLRHNPLVSSVGCFTLAGALLALSGLADPEWTSPLAASLHVAAVVAAIGGLLILFRSTAVTRIDRLQQHAQELRNEVARMTLCSDQISSTLQAVIERRAEPGQRDPMSLARNSIETAATRTAAAIDTSVRIYLVEISAQAYVVRVAAGIERFGIDEGKSCPADRPLAEVLPTLAPAWHAAPLEFLGSKYSLVLLSDRQLTRADTRFVEQFALVLSLAGEETAERDPQPSSADDRPLKVV